MSYNNLKNGLSHEDIPPISYWFVRTKRLHTTVKFPIESFVELNVTIHLYKIVTHSGVIEKTN